MTEEQNKTHNRNLKLVVGVTWVFLFMWFLASIWPGSERKQTNNAEDSLRVVIEVLNDKIKHLDSAVKADQKTVEESKVSISKNKVNVVVIEKKVRTMTSDELARFFLDSVRYYGKQE